MTNANKNVTIAAILSTVKFVVVGTEGYFIEFTV